MSDLIKAETGQGNSTGTPENGIELLINARQRDLGGITIQRVLPFVTRRMVGPWIFLDHIGPVEFQPGAAAMEIPPHPHIGLATVTYLFEGQIMHRDSLGFVQPIEPGAINLMVSGKGIAHSERSVPELRAKGFRVHALQLWLALPVEQEEIDPAFYHYAARDLPSRETPAMHLRVMMGAAFGLSSPVKTYSPTLYAEAMLQAGAELQLPGDVAERAVYVVAGTVQINGQPVPAHTMAVCREGAEIVVTADSAAQIAIIGGANIGTRHIWWNFVSSRRERIEQAKADWREGRFAAVPGETELTPLPQF